MRLNMVHVEPPAVGSRVAAIEEAEWSTSLSQDVAAEY